MMYKCITLDVWGLTPKPTLYQVLKDTLGRTNMECDYWKQKLPIVPFNVSCVFTGQRQDKLINHGYGNISPKFRTEMNSEYGESGFFSRFPLIVRNDYIMNYHAIKHLMG